MRLPKFYRNRSIGERVIAFQTFSNKAAVRYLEFKQELSYRKQIARQLRKQYVEGMYRSKCYTVTLKSMLRVTQGHWKWNHWI